MTRNPNDNDIGELCCEKMSTTNNRDIESKINDNINDNPYDLSRITVPKIRIEYRIYRKDPYDLSQIGPPKYKFR